MNATESILDLTANIDAMTAKAIGDVTSTSKS